MVEIYGVGQSTNRAGNISTRGTVRLGDGVMIAGCLIGGNQAEELVIRARTIACRTRRAALFVTLAPGIYTTIENPAPQDSILS